MSMYKLTIRDEREGWMPHYGRQLAQAEKEEREAEAAYGHPVHSCAVAWGLLPYDADEEGGEG